MLSCFEVADLQDQAWLPVGTADLAAPSQRVFLPTPVDTQGDDEEVSNVPPRVAAMIRLVDGTALRIREDGRALTKLAARLDEVSQQVEYLKQAGLEPHVIDVRPFALLRALRGSLLGEHLTKTTLASENFTEANEVGVVLEIAASSSTVTLVRGQRVLMNRNINVSGDDFTAAIQRAFGLDFDSAEEVKLEYGTATVPTEDEEDLLNFDAKREQFSPGRVYEALRPVLVELTTEIRRSLEFFRVQSGDANISRMLVTGGGAKLRGLPEAIGDALGFRVELGDPWLTINVDENRFDTQYLKKVGSEFAVPLGLALRGVAGVD